jgi:hypothetical protein
VTTKYFPSEIRPDEELPQSIIDFINSKKLQSVNKYLNKIEKSNPETCASSELLGLSSMKNIP